jgi:hypothetical protein
MNTDIIDFINLLADTPSASSVREP